MAHTGCVVRAEGTPIAVAAAKAPTTTAAAAEEQPQQQQMHVIAPRVRVRCA